MSVTRAPAWQSWTEKEWLEQVRKLASQLGWLTYHPHQSQRSEPGFPDLTLVRERVVFVELKRHAASSKLSPHQELWRDRLLAAGAEHYVWRPADADNIIRILGKRRPVQVQYVGHPIGAETPGQSPTPGRA